MIIKCDSDGHNVIKQLLDISLKAHGLKNVKPVVDIMNQIELIEEVKEDENNNISED